MPNGKSVLVVMVVLCFLAGCTASPSTTPVSQTEVGENIAPVPERISFTAPTFDRDVDNGAVHDLRSSFDGPVLMLWVAAGCSGFVGQRGAAAPPMTSLARCTAPRHAHPTKPCYYVLQLCNRPTNPPHRA